MDIPKHDTTCPLFNNATPAGQNYSAIGGRLTYQFTYTNMGRITKVLCACGADIDLTEYDW